MTEKPTDAAHKLAEAHALAEELAALSNVDGSYLGNAIDAAVSAAREEGWYEGQRDTLKYLSDEYSDAQRSGCDPSAALACAAEAAWKLKRGDM